MPWDSPPWLCQTRLESKVLGIDEPNKFWGEIPSEALAKAAVPDVLDSQTRLLGEKVGVITGRETTLAEGMTSCSFLFRRGLQGGGELAVATCFLTSVGPAFDSCLCIPRAIGKGGR